MNWEGHDDWLADAGPALAFELSSPHAVLLPNQHPDCGPAEPVSASNPYEQIPLKRRDCRAPAEEAEPER